MCSAPPGPAGRPVDAPGGGIDRSTPHLHRFGTAVSDKGFPLEGSSTSQIALRTVATVASILILSGLLTASVGQAGRDANDPRENDVPYDSERPSPWRTVDVYYRQRRPAEERPVVLLVHGGGWEMGGKESFAAQAQAWAAYGWLVLTVGYDYHAANRWNSLPRDMDAVLAWIAGPAQKRYNIDIDRVAIVGISAGAHLGLLAGLRQDHWPPGLHVAAISSWIGPTDLSDMVRGCTHFECQSGQAGAYITQRYVGDCFDDECVTAAIRPCFLSAEPACPERYQAGSPLAYVDPGDPPVQMYYSSLDPIVPFTQAVALEEALEDAGVPRDCVRSDGRQHETPPSAGTGTQVFLRAVLDGRGEMRDRECMLG